MSDYNQYIVQKLSRVPPTGIVDNAYVPRGLFDHQTALYKWACRRGRAAIFADTGLGKSRMQLAWAEAVRRHTGKPVLILAPLAVAPQTVQEGREIGIEVTHCRDGAETVGCGIVITNYDRLHRFDPSMFVGVVLDESSCIKHHDAKTLRTLLTAFRDTPFKLCATATPAPNDWTELGTHAEFLGVCTRAEMLAEYFTHDGGDTSVWRLKGHARHIFWQWVSQWGAMVRKPSDLGFDDTAYALPPLHLHEHTVATEMPLNGMLFAAEAQTLSERRDARRMSKDDRINECGLIVYGDWYKLAASEKWLHHGVETGTRGSSQGARGSEPVSSGKALAVSEGEPRTEQRGAQRIHAGLLRSEPGEVHAQDAGEAICVQRSTQEEVRGKQGLARCAQGNGAPVASGQPRETACAADTEVWTDAGNVQGAYEVARMGLCDLRSYDGIGEDVPDGRSLSLDWKGARDSLLKLQHGARQVQGQSGTVDTSHRVPIEPWLIWCELNAEQDMLEKVFGELAFSVRGSDPVEDKESRITAWLRGDRPVMISKSSIMGFGLNFQHCRNVAFVGVTDSFEAYYQAVRRCWRFGQKRDVHVHVFASSSEGAVVANLKRKERDATAMAESLSQETRDAVMQEVTGTTRQTNIHNAGQRVTVPSFLKEAA